MSLVLASPSIANAATPIHRDWSGTDTTVSVKSDAAKAPKLYPSDLPELTSETLETLSVQRLTLDPASVATLPQSPPLDTETMVTEAAGLMVETSAGLQPTPPPIPGAPLSAPTPGLTFAFSDSVSFEGTSFLGASPPSFGNGQIAHPTADATFEQGTLTAQAINSADTIPWRFSIEPYFYVPFGANGDITVRGVNAPINAGIGDIFDAIVNDLNFAAFGRVEAWNGPWGILFDGTYMNVGTGQSAAIPVPTDLQLQGLPPQVTIDAAVGTSYTKLDLAGGYRFGDGNLSNAFRTANTEFDLGPFVFDAIAGLRLYFFNNDLVLTSDLGQRFQFGQSKTVAEPMIGGRARWNLSHNLAVITGASMSGFGIGGLTFSVDGYAGVDWLFSGNTSLLASYRLTYVDYSSGSSGLNLFTHGPSIGVKFRF